MPIYPIGHQLTILETVDSSNNYAMQMVQQKGAIHGQVFFALDQTAGKGQRGKVWHSEPTSNIIMSVVLETTGLAASDQFYLSMAMALGCRNWFAQKAGDETSVKWPNDIYWRDRKAGGMLIENKWFGQEWQFSVVGIGINLNQTQFPQTSRKPVSLRQITGRNLDLLQEARLLCEELENRWQQLRRGEKQSIHTEYQSRLFGMNKICRFRRNTIEFETRVVGVSEQGELLTQDQTARRFKVGEIEWV
jgi:BirA family biotin operon repressor/biotin-[acetyl-CoA-carboxylase] ligase